LVGGIAQGTPAAIRAWRARMRQRRELLMLNDIELHELSLTEADVNREARKLFWETIQLTGRRRYRPRRQADFRYGTSSTTHDVASNQYQSYDSRRKTDGDKENGGSYAVVMINTGPECCVSRRRSGKQNQ